MIKGKEENYTLRFYSNRTELERVLILSCLFSISMVIFRVIYTGQFLFISMIWNLFLAYIPYGLSRWISKNINHKGKAAFLAATLIWLLFIPNAFYIITDLFHLDRRERFPLWYDLAMLFSLAWNGLLFGIISVRQMELLFESYYGKKIELLFTYPIMLLSALGIYIGRYLRFNSWDVVSNPIILVRNIIYLFIHPLRNRFDWGMIICYSFLLTLIYITLKKMGKGDANS